MRHLLIEGVSMEDKEKKTYDKEKNTLVQELKKNPNTYYTAEELINKLNFQHKKRYLIEDLIIITDNTIKTIDDKICYEDIEYLNKDFDFNIIKLIENSIEFMIFLKNIENFYFFKAFAIIIMILFMNIEFGLLFTFSILFLMKTGTEKSENLEAKFLTFTFIYSSVYFIINNFGNITRMSFLKNIIPDSNAVFHFLDEKLNMDYLNIIVLLIALFIYLICQYIKNSDTPSKTVYILKIYAIMFFTQIAVIFVNQNNNLLNRDIDNYFGITSFINIDDFINPSTLLSINLWGFLIMIHLFLIVTMFKNIFTKKFNDALYLLILTFIASIFVLNYDGIRNNYYESKKFKNENYCSNLPYDSKIIKESDHKFKVLTDSIDTDKSFNKNNRFIYTECK